MPPSLDSILPLKIYPYYLNSAYRCVVDTDNFYGCALSLVSILRKRVRRLFPFLLVGGCWFCNTMDSSVYIKSSWSDYEFSVTFTGILYSSYSSRFRAPMIDVVVNMLSYPKF